MGVFENYSCTGQMHLLDFIQKTEEDLIWDADVREVQKRLEELAEQFGCTVGNTEFKVWSHVPKLGFRLWMDMKIPKEVMILKEFEARVNEIVADVRDMKVELTPMWGACIFRGGEEHINLSFTTMFLDKARQKIK